MKWNLLTFSALCFELESEKWRSGEESGKDFATGLRKFLFP